MLKSVLAVLLSVAAGTTVAQGNYFYGLNYGVDSNACPSYEDIKADFAKIKPYTNRVRTYAASVCNQGALALRAANELDMNIYLGLWLNNQQSVFNDELNALKAILNSGESLAKVDAVIAGSEVLYRNELDADTLTNYISQIGQALKPKGVAVTYSDVYYKLPPQVVQQLDFVMMYVYIIKRVRSYGIDTLPFLYRNAFSYWEGVPVAQGSATLFQHYDQVVSIAQGKTVRISETGWPAGGSNFGSSIASPANQALYLKNVLCESRRRNIDLIYFAAADEPYDGCTDCNWGVLDVNFNLKTTLPVSLLENPCA
jgi:glucan 1,3-beta-glucosidase